ncbi:alcohol dehydrogenase catalytic domain-containing protein [Saccharopolyspora sp. K220]|uniref:zinc-binding dehydrogenase n=1 Tax=Saccharopolyspora soli TaxID=2926618 RepID=UPI001F58AFE1|nr:alcohol dehydrogenase catalytic domain-containing protein [Saccharopolyspora soli]MCI2419926.1 alcohol dehydrogenase catalytic domain-containing protein [Saccharopolyspora soli]
MKIRSAVLRRSGAEQPYAVSCPLEVTELELAPPGSSELMVRIRAAEVCHSDLSVVDGNRPRPLPTALGHEAAGEVVEIGPGVTDVAVGDHVVLTFMPSCGSCAHCERGRPALRERGAAANGAGDLLCGGRRLREPDGAPVTHHLGVSAFSDHAVVDRSSAVVVPSAILFPTAALFGCAMVTGMGAVRNAADVDRGDAVCVLGLGGGGLAAVLGAAVAGAGTIVVVDPVAEKRKLALELGATHACAPEDAEDAVAATSGGVRWAFEAAGVIPAMEQAFALLGRGGTAVSAGLPAPGLAMTLPALPFAGEGKGFLGSYMGSSQPQEDIPTMVALWDRGLLPVEKLLSATTELGQVNEAFDALAEGTAVRKVILP